MLRDITQPVACSDAGPGEASALVNGGSIDRVPVKDVPHPLVVHHLGTEDHDVILANGAPAGTFIDHAGRATFDNCREYAHLQGCEWTLPERNRQRN